MPIFIRRAFYLSVKLGPDEPVRPPIWDHVKRPSDLPFEAGIKSQCNLASIGPHPPMSCLRKVRFSMPDQHAPYALSPVLWMRGHGAQPMADATWQIWVFLGHEGSDSHHEPIQDDAEMKHPFLIIHGQSTCSIWLFFRPQDTSPQRPRLFR